MPAPPRFAAYLLLTASMALVGSYVALSKPLVAALPVFALAFLRFAIGAVAMIPWTPRARGEAPLTRERAPLALPDVVLRQLPVLGLHADRHRHDDRHGGRA